MAPLLGLWKVCRDAVTWEANLRARGSEWNLRLLKNGIPVIREQFPTKVMAVQWANLAKANLEKGWGNEHSPSTDGQSHS